MKVNVDQSICCGYENCIVEAPTVFDLNAEGKSYPLIAEPPPELYEEVRRAAASCPVHAIVITE